MTKALSPSVARIATGALAAALAIAASATLTPPRLLAAGAQQENGALLLAIGESRVINLPENLSDVVIADPAVLDVHVRSQRQIYLIAKGPGETNVFVTSTNGKMLYANAVRVGNNITSIDQMLTLAMPDAHVQVSTMNGMILLTGTIAAPEDAAEVQRLVQAFAGDKTQVVSRLKTATPLQVNLQVRIAEVNKTLAKNIGFNLATMDTTSGFKFGIGQGRTAINDVWNVGGPLAVGNGLKAPQGYAIDPNTGLFKTTKEAIGTAITSQTSGSTLGFDTKLFGLDILGALDLAETQGLSTTLANPNLTALSGETASFLAGGEIPIPLSSSLGNVSVEFKQYGVSLAFTPTVLADGRISMRVRPEVSQLDASAGVRLNSFTIPGVSTRRAETTVELGSGQSFVIGGLLSTSSSNTIDKAPFLGDLPILGNLFKSKGWRRQETELVIVVTPYLVKPVNARDIALPTDGYRNPTDAQQIFTSQLHDGDGKKKRPVPQAAAPTTVTPDQVGTKTSKGKGKAAAPGFSF
ncbi:type II and III secretion system protein family protein [Sphingobium nicotianae]|uniref:Type II and III secretion system protein family protein n=1 Tax=Sphingobium nicotianae TaxID=2782607 RepID=A0A9X1IQH5_9SPHN|nr:type II and III secretion system protein family protein [Sphingobium nicotianae]MBT2186631.1 type II and III secretion system protein family protein [Sphingobium nicotianae]